MSEEKTKNADLPLPTASAAAAATVTLAEPIRRGTQTITTVELRKPKAGELRGLNLSELLMSRYDALEQLLPRITTPTLLKQDIANLDPVDLVNLGTEVAGFFVSAETLAELKSQTA